MRTVKESSPKREAGYLGEQTSSQGMKARLRGQGPQGGGWWGGQGPVTTGLYAVTLGARGTVSGGFGNPRGHKGGLEAASPSVCSGLSPHCRSTPP